ncbi:MAG: serine--tRNA ligase, partial [Rhodospirillales bacterium]|nr:serine--tRNA ligase [Rhodospirillales bacterium]
MHDIRAIRSDPAAFDAAMARRGLGPVAAEILALDEQRRGMVSAIQEEQTARKAQAREVGALMRAGRKEEAEALRVRIAAGEASADIGAVAAIEEDLQDILAGLPNILDADVPDGADEAANVVLRTHGQPAHFDFAPRQHFELGEALGMMDFATAAKLAGARFTVLRGKLARLERALGQFMLDLHTGAHGYTETIVPSLVNDATMFGTGQLPKFADDLFRTTDGRWLIPTAEVPLTNSVAGEIVAPERLPIRLTALTDCYRSEAGSAGRDTRGMLRQHQFRKVELVSIVAPEQSEAELERMTAAAEAVLEALGLTFRRVVLCSGDTGFGAARTHDLEVWLAGQQAWREISSCSNCRDFQARRMGARLRGTDGRAAGLLHTLNGSGV